MNVQRFLMAILFMAFLSSSLLAQGHFCHPHSLTLTDELKTSLNISSEQSEQLDKIQIDMQNQMGALHQNPDITHGELQQQRRLLIEQNRSAVKGVLTINQGQQLRQYMQEKKHSHREAWASVDKKAMHKEMAQYHHNNIKPVIQQQREKLESNLTQTEKNNIANIKTQVQEVKVSKKNQHEARRGKAHDRPHPQHKEGQRHPSQKPGPPRFCHHDNGLMNWLHQNQDAYATLQAIIDNHQVQIDQMLEEVASQRTEWKTAREAIFDNYAPNGESFRHQPQNGNEELHAIHKARREAAVIMRFLLHPMPKEEKPLIAENDLKLSVYPNPVTNRTTVMFELKEAAQLSLLLTNEKGYTVKTFPVEQYKAGQNKIDVDLSDVPNGTYTLILKGLLRTPSSVKLIVVR